jgi:hypothetical protein
MSIALTNLDDRRWSDLVEEGRALIPFYSPEWTDHNVHDPGITLIELFAWLAEMDIYGLNRISENHLRKFLSLVDIHPESPHAAIAALVLNAKAGSRIFRLPGSVEFDGRDAFGVATRFRSLSSVNVVATELKAVQASDKDGFKNLTNNLQRLEEVEPFGPDPAIGDAFYLGFSKSLPIETIVSLLFISQDLSEGQFLRAKLLTEQEAEAIRCERDILPQCNSNSIHAVARTRRAQLLEHHSVRLVWEFFSAESVWLQFATSGVLSASEVVDDTRALTLNGRVLLKVPSPMARTFVGKVTDQLYYVRARIIRGSYDAAPRLRYCAINGILAEQSAPVGLQQWTISGAARIDGSAPTLGHPSWIRMQFNQRNEIAELTFGKLDHAARFTVLEYQAPQNGRPGLLKAEAATLGAGDGRPNLRLALPQSPALLSNFAIFTVEDGCLRKWFYRTDFDGSKRADPHFKLDPTRGLVFFGDGERGRVVPPSAPVLARYDSTRATEGNLLANTITALADSPHNRALLGNSFDEVKGLLAQVANPLAAAGGTAAEPLTHAIGRAIESVEKTDRAVILADYEMLAGNVPGTRIARVSARANLHPDFPCLAAQGMITVIVLPYLPADLPAPSVGVRSAIKEYLFPRRIIGTRVEVIGPNYKQVTVSARVKAMRGANAAEVASRVKAALNQFFHPLTGGPDGTGWPFGRDVFRSEVLQLIDDTPGVDHVTSLELSNGCGEPQCGNICLAANELVAAGQHQIQVS